MTFCRNIPLLRAGPVILGQPSRVKVRVSLTLHSTASPPVRHLATFSASGRSPYSTPPSPSRVFSRPVPINPSFFVRKMTSTSTASRRQPPWTKPTPADSATLPKLKIYNSLTRNKVPFVPLDPEGRKVTWYCCGPTVYDAGHLGHARNYVTTDILRRIMRDYFGFDVVFVQNVTDVDDKIILRARENYLFSEYCSRNPEITSEVRETALRAWAFYLNQSLKPEDIEPVTPELFTVWVSSHANLSHIYAIVDKESKRKPGEEVEEIPLNEKDTKLKMHIKTLLSSAAVLAKAPESAEAFYGAVSSILPKYLDSTAQKEGRSYGMEIFSKLSTYWENHFNEDMRKLNVLPPTIITRVSEFIPENVAFVQRLVEKGLAYPTQNGSVYFDIQAYEAAGHHYAKLEPWNKGDAALIADGEGSLSAAPTDPATVPETPLTNSNVFAKEKKSASDFALWKCSKQGEPSWPSPWGPGRPGWHIECSVMASHVLGGKIDIHSGGVDLAFPHHDNEIAQSEAYWEGDFKDNNCCGSTEGDGKHQWINYFLHMGHLSIQGSKMSKSLKNFVSIREALARGPKGEVPAWTARGLRVVFLMGGWKEGIEVGMGVLVEARSWEESIGKFFTVVKALVAEEAEKEKNGEFVPMKFTAAEAQIYKDLDHARSAVHAALCDNFNTPLAMNVIAELVTKANVYMLNNRNTFSLPALKEIARWITRMVNIFGLDPAPYAGDKIGWRDATVDDAQGTANKEEILMPYLRVLSSFRDKIRALAISSEEVPSTDLLIACDVLRNDELPPLGVSLDDREGEKALVKLVPAEELLAQKAEKERKAAEKERRRLELKAEREEAERRKLEAGELSHLEMFRPPHCDEYSEWDDDGIPTKMKEGEEVTKSRIKKLKKEWEKQKKLHDAYIAWRSAQEAN
ncbi:tRNA synthetases class I (C) catalytic domain-containing protein [Kalaharituber pfeilii]|nr:tRNA synthetases class I (C) catalytic domain-containing protein [Kalaharituber pfeilii]